MAEKKKIKVTKEMMKGNPEIQEALTTLVDNVEPLNKELIKTIKNIDISKDEVRMLVDNYYQTQAKRIVVESQMRSIIQNTDNTISTELVSWSLNQMKILEDAHGEILSSVSMSSETGRWLRKIMGIGPTLACALIAYFDIEKATSAGHFLSYAGLNDNNAPKIGKDKAKLIVEECINSRDGVLDDVTVAKIAQATGRKLSTLLQKSTNAKGKIVKNDLIKAVSFIPYNKNLKVICWKCGHQFALLQNNEKSLYGRILRERKAQETLWNEQGKFANQAKMILGSDDWEFDRNDFCSIPDYEADDDVNLDDIIKEDQMFKNTTRILRSKKFDKSTDAYKALSQGMLPKSQIQARAERFATKLFISHLFEKMYIDKYGKMPPKPYVIEHMGHVDYIEPEVPYI